MGASDCKSAPRVVGVRGSYAGGDIMYLICHVNSHDHLIEKTCEFMGVSCSRYVTMLTIFATINIVMVEI